MSQRENIIKNIIYCFFRKWGDLYNIIAGIFVADFEKICTLYKPRIV